MNMHTKTTVAPNPDQVQGTSLSKAGAKGDEPCSAADPSFLAAEPALWKQRKQTHMEKGVNAGLYSQKYGSSCRAGNHLDPDLSVQPLRPSRGPPACTAQDGKPWDADEDFAQHRPATWGCLP